jgi:hypothetical protein
MFRRRMFYKQAGFYLQTVFGDIGLVVAAIIKRI